MKHFSKRDQRKLRLFKERLARKRMFNNSGKSNERRKWSTQEHPQQRAFNPAHLRCGECNASTYVKGINRKRNRMKVEFDCSHVRFITVNN